MKLQDIDLDLIIPDENQPRKDFEGIEDLANNIKEQSLIQPIEVRVSNDKFIIIDGERRFKAYQLLNKKVIPCIVNTKDNEILLRQLSSDIHKRNFGFTERMNAIEQLLKVGYSKDVIKKNLGLSKGYFTDLLYAIKLEPETKEIIKDRNFNGRDIKTFRKELSTSGKSEKELVSEIKLSRENITDFFLNNKKSEIYLAINRCLNNINAELYKSFSIMDIKQLTNKDIRLLREKIDKIEILLNDTKRKLQ